MDAVLVLIVDLRFLLCLGLRRVYMFAFLIPALFPAVGYSSVCWKSVLGERFAGVSPLGRRVFLSFVVFLKN